MNAQKPDYGIDAPTVVRNLAVFGIAILVIAGLVLLLHLHSLHETALSFLWTGVLMLAFAAYMILSSKVLKFSVRDRLLNDLELGGHEQVLDVGCGRGLALIGVAKRLTSGRAIGIDLWSAHDLSANTAEATLANAQLEGVLDRITVETGDMRNLPYPDASFDAVISMTAIHNIKDEAGRIKALEEIVRVMKPGARLAIFDIFHPFAYKTVLQDQNIGDLRVSGLLWLWAMPGVRITGRKG